MLSFEVRGGNTKSSLLFRDKNIPLRLFIKTKFYGTLFSTNLRKQR